MTKYYKVVNSDLTSATVFKADPIDKRTPVQYKINEWVNAPNNTRLFVFDNLDEAKKFAWERVARLFECQIKGRIKHQGVDRFAHTSLFWEEFNLQLKKKKKINISKYPTASTPAVLAKSVKLTKEIHV